MPVINSVFAEAPSDCDAVVETLIREHLTKKQYTNTLAAFEQEEVSGPASCSPVDPLFCATNFCTIRLLQIKP
jgi:hypothetical protein